jgi:hypothetical protein
METSARIAYVVIGLKGNRCFQSYRPFPNPTGQWELDIVRMSKHRHSKLKENCELYSAFQQVIGEKDYPRGFFQVAANKYFSCFKVLWQFSDARDFAWLAYQATD